MICENSGAPSRHIAGSLAGRNRQFAGNDLLYECQRKVLAVFGGDACQIGRADFQGFRHGSNAFAVLAMAQGTVGSVEQCSLDRLPNNESVCMSRSCFLGGPDEADERPTAD